MGTDIWRQSVHTHDPPAGPHEVVVRATDGTGALQPREAASPFPNGASGGVSRTIRGLVPGKQYLRLPPRLPVKKQVVTPSVLRSLDQSVETGKPEDVELVVDDICRVGQHSVEVEIDVDESTGEVVVRPAD